MKLRCLCLVICLLADFDYVRPAPSISTLIFENSTITGGNETIAEDAATPAMAKAPTEEPQKSVELLIANLERRFELKFKELNKEIAETSENAFFLGQKVTSLREVNEHLQNELSTMREAIRESKEHSHTSETELQFLRRRLHEVATELEDVRQAGVNEEERRRKAEAKLSAALEQFGAQLAGHASMTFTFAHQTNVSMNAKEQRLQRRIVALGKSWEKAEAKLERRLDSLGTRQDATELRLRVWNVTRMLQECRKSARDDMQESRLTMQERRSWQLVKKAQNIHNLTTSMREILYENNRITNSLTNFKNRAKSVIDSIVLNMAHLAKTMPSSCSSDTITRSGSQSIQIIVPSYKLGEMRAAQCRFTADNSWTVIQQRQVHDTDFNRRWAEYEAGFGDVQGDYWLGLKLIHNIVATGKWKLRVEFWDEHNKYYFGVYRDFYVGDRSTNYRLRVGNFYGTAGDSMSRSTGCGFSAPDKDNDNSVVHCARFEEAGWWMSNCHGSNLNGKRPFGIIWYHISTGDYLHLKRTRMMISPLTPDDLTTTPAPTTTQMTTTSANVPDDTQSTSQNATESPDSEERSQNFTESPEDHEAAQNVTEGPEKSSTARVELSEESQNVTDSPEDNEAAQDVTEAPKIVTEAPEKSSTARVEPPEESLNVTDSPEDNEAAQDVTQAPKIVTESPDDVTTSRDRQVSMDDSVNDFVKKVNSTVPKESRAEVAEQVELEEPKEDENEDENAIKDKGELRAKAKDQGAEERRRV